MIEGACEIALNADGARYVVDSRTRQLIQIVRWVEVETDTGTELRQNPYWARAPLQMSNGEVRNIEC